MKIEKLVLGPVMTNCYVYYDEQTKQGVVVDPADAAERIIAAVRRHGLDIRYILLTHNHFDHIQAVGETAEALGVPVAIHEADAAGLPDMEISLGTFSRLCKPQPPADILLKDGDTLTVGEHSIQVIHTPGHTPGCVCYLCEGSLFSGDTLFAGDVGRCDLPGGNFETLKDSIKKKLLPLEDFIRVYPGHGEPTDIGRERRENQYF